MAAEKRISPAVILIPVGLGLAGLLGIFALAKAAPPPPEPGLASPYGTVADGETGEAIPNALVTLNGYSVRTDSYGFYSFENLELGAYNITIEKDGYDTISSGITLVEGLNELNVGLVPIVVPAMLSGIVTDSETGQPIKGVKVTVNGMITYTNTIGEYLFVDLEPGDYTVTFEKEGYEVLVK